MNNNLRYFSMYSGIGGFELGIQNAYRSQKRKIKTDTTSVYEDGTRLQPKKGESVSASIRQSGQCIANRIDERPLCVGYSEIDKYAIKVYERHFDGHTNYGNADTINEKELPDFDLLVGGFPCQSFSIAGKRQGFNDTRGTQFFNIARILAEKRPRHLVLENVKGLLSHDSGKTFQTILGILSDLGYRVEWQVLNSKDFGVPQNRERVFIVGHLGNKCGRQVFPISNTHRPTTERIQGHYTNTLTARYEGAQATGSYIIESELDAQKIKSAATRTRTYVGIPETLEIRNDNVSNTINSVTKDYYATDMSRIRRLTPKECERLQGFPDDWTAGESDTQRYKMCGNAVTVNVVANVIGGIL